MKLLLLLVALLLGAGCPTEEGDPTPANTPVDDGYGYCPQETRVGGFVVEVGPQYTTISGAVADGTPPWTVFDELDAVGDCRLLHPPTLFCDPACDAGTTCGPGGECVTTPANIDVGAVEVEGLTGEVSLRAIPPTQTYFFTGDLPEPAASPGDRVELYVGDERSGPSMVAFGVEALAMEQESMALQSDADAVLRWTAATTDVDARVHVAVDIANHGGVPATIVCETADDGALDIDASLTAGLLFVGASGFPTVTITRRSADTAEGAGGCFDFVMQSQEVLPVEIDGLISCSDPDDCPPNQTCRGDLTCG